MEAALPLQSLWIERRLTMPGPTGRHTREPHALVVANCKILMCYSMLGISQQLLFASVMRPHYTLLD